MQAQTVAPPDLQCKDKFLVQSVVVGDGLSAKDVTPQMVMVLLERSLMYYWFTVFFFIMNLWLGVGCPVHKRRGQPC
jgi:hypothetical protein